MNDLHIITAGDVAIREDAEGDGRTIHGYAYRWGELTDPGGTSEFGELAEGFERGAFTAAIADRGGRLWPFLDQHRGRTVAGIRFAEDEVGLRYEGRLLDTAAAREYAASVPAGNDAVSLEFMYRGAKSARRGKTVIHQSIPRIAALAGVYAGAYTGATVALREDGGNITMDEQELTPPAPAPAPVTREMAAAIATEAATEVVRELAERGTLRAGPSDPLAGYRSLGEMFIAAREAGMDDDARRAFAQAIAKRALDDTVFTAGANAGLASGNLVRSEIAGIVNRGRPIINAFGTAGLGGTSGLTLEFPYFDGTLTDFVGAQSAEKAEITSAAVDIKVGTEALVTYAGGSDISYQVMSRGNPSILDAYARIWLAAWSAVTETAAATEVESGSATVDFAEALSAVDATELTAHLITASLAVETATGSPAAFVLAGTTAFQRAANLFAALQSTQVSGPDFNLSGLSIALGGLPIIHAPALTTGKFVASNRQAGRWHEDGPFPASAEDVAKLGRNVAYWSLGAFVRYTPAGIVEIYDVTP